MTPRQDRVINSLRKRRDCVGAWLITSAAVGLLLLQAAAPKTNCCLVAASNTGETLLSLFSELAKGI